MKQFEKTCVCKSLFPFRVIQSSNFVALPNLLFSFLCFSTQFQLLFTRFFEHETSKSRGSLEQADGSRQRETPKRTSSPNFCLIRLSSITRPGGIRAPATFVLDACRCQFIAILLLPPVPPYRYRNRKVAQSVKKSMETSTRPAEAKVALVSPPLSIDKFQSYIEISVCSNFSFRTSTSRSTLLNASFIRRLSV